MAQRVWPMPEFFRALVLLALLSVSVLALWPSPSQVITTGWDKANHFIAFFVLFGLMDFAWPRQLSMLHKVLLLLAYGFAIELIQAGMARRYFSMLDWVADGIGLAVYYVFHFQVRRLEWIIKRLPFIDAAAATEWRGWR